MKISKIILSLILGCAFAFSAFTFAACKVSGGEAAPSEQTPSGNNNGDTNNSGGNNNNQDGDFGNKEELQLSAITKKLMTDDYYLNLARKIMKESRILTKEMLPIPYKFLRNRGHNVNAYLDGTLDAFASSYIYDNDKNHIYVSVKAENVSTSQYGNYYTNYVLKYPLTDQEYEDYTYLCEDESLQGLLFIQELDNQKTPEILFNNNISVSTYNDMIIEYSKWKDANIINKNKLEIDLQKFGDEEIIISVRGSSISNYYSTQIGLLKITPTLYTGIKYYDNIYYMSAAENVLLNHQEEYQSSLQNITSFSYGQQIEHASPYPNDFPVLNGIN